MEQGVDTMPGTRDPESFRALVRAVVGETVGCVLASGLPSTVRTSVPADEVVAEPGAGEVSFLLTIHDRLCLLRDQIDERRDGGKRKRRRWRAELRVLADMLQSVLQRLRQLGVTPMPFPERVDYALHDPVDVRPTISSLDNGRVVDVYRRGFVRDGRVIRLMQVAVLKYVPAPVRAADISTEKET